ncbi:GNAT family N-acetyltransferase [Parerythrobacter jejuensis]|uniref:GNAT family N-acetyltransferase n=1 Tax=Parerythrobacter jejuensis TaxID=795812 RepID=A0A845AR42_9SPHN|nr:GNAT family N-acetyltransferase [Parerythrobacter jejuensis]MXP31355.1 GNAT family N-acetyltransferase [Parerythrobacter jejuensis]MXP34115.1 GNAT family N-acetyltransferase [Parerythrobacter jejuensis]
MSDPALQPTPIHFTLGSRRLLSVPRTLTPLRFSLEDILKGETPDLAHASDESDGLRILSAPQALVARLEARFPDHIKGGYEAYRRHYIAMDGSYEDYLARFSGKTRSTLRRKQRKLAKLSGGELAITEHRSPAEIEAFLDAALPLSEKTYQTRLLDAGLPCDDVSRTEFLAQAEAGELRCFLLHYDGAPVAYLTLPIEGETLVYAYLGYDPDHASLSVGTVLQMEALERLFAEQRFRYFDFTEGEGAHKAMFGTDNVECASFLLLRRTLSNRLLLSARDGFDGTIARAKALAAKSGALGSTRKFLRA